MAISETALRDTVLMMVQWQNARGGLLGRQLEAVVVDPASNWPLFAEKARELLAVSKVDVTYGCWTSVSRKSVLPVFEELNGLLFYPVQYEGEEQSRNIFYTGAAPNQQAIPAVEYLLGPDGGNAKRIALLGTDYVYPRTTNRILRGYLNSKGIADADIMEEYTPFGHSDWQGIVTRVKQFAAQGKKTAIVSTINGDANVPFYRELGNQGIKAEDIPSVAFSVGEEELAGIDTRPLVGHLAAWNYFMSVPGPANASSWPLWRAYINNPRRVTNDPMEATVTGFKMWAQAVAAANTTAVDAVRDRDVRPEGHGRLRLRGGDAPQPSPLQAGDDRRDPGRWSVQHRLQDADRDPGRELVALHPRERQPPALIDRRRALCLTPAPLGAPGRKAAAHHPPDALDRRSDSICRCPH
jgi:urea transport system substrate-binding protein